MLLTAIKVCHIYRPYILIKVLYLTADGRWRHPRRTYISINRPDCLKYCGCIFAAVCHRRKKTTLLTYSHKR